MPLFVVGFLAALYWRQVHWRVSSVLVHFCVVRREWRGCVWLCVLLRCAYEILKGFHWNFDDRRNLIIIVVGSWMTLGFTPRPSYHWERASGSHWTEGRLELGNCLDVSDKTLLFLPESDNSFSIVQHLSRMNGVLQLLHLEDLGDIKFTHCHACRSAFGTNVYKSVWRCLKVCCGRSCSECEG